MWKNAAHTVHNQTAEEFNQKNGKKEEEEVVEEKKPHTI